MKDWIFEMVDKSGIKIHLSKDVWNHITTKHTNMSDKLEDIKKALTNPILIISNQYDENKRNYFLHYKHKNRYLLVSVKYLNGEGYITTAFIARHIKKR